MNTIRTCTWCGTQNIVGECPTCSERFESLPDPEYMSGEERYAEFMLYGIAEIKFSKLWNRLDDLVGRKIMLHEFGAYESLAKEAQTRSHPTLKQALDIIPEGKRMIIKVNSGRIADVLMGEIANDDDAPPNPLTN